MSDTAPNSTTTESSQRFSASAALGGADWPARAADAVEHVVDTVHDTVIRPLILVVRGIVYGLLVMAMTLVLGVLVAIASVRLLDSYTYPFGHRVWAAETFVGGLFTILGFAAWSLRRSRRAAKN
ncbi:MAG: hypothetical protein ACYDD4_00995 [Acidimicrobiales bacterium]